jgi:hypothetical protein
MATPDLAGAFFSFTEVPDAARHRAYNEWHQLEHRPENLRLPGVTWGERWVHSPDCRPVSDAPDTTFSNLHYVNMYWFREPVAESTAAWSGLAERSFQWGGRDDIHIANRLFIAFFRPIRGYVNRRARVEADVLPFRPNRGVHVKVTRVDEPRSGAAEKLFGWYDREHIPALLACDGVAGAWTFASEDTFASALDLSGEAAPPSVRVVLTYLDDDPIAVTRAVGALDGPPDPSVETTLFSGALRAITPWEWDWFDD